MGNNIPSCHHAVESPVGMDFYSLIWWIFITGLAGSFAHCITMCGPIALAQLNIRLMKLSPAEMHEKEKFRAAFLAPYYIGKAATYSLLAGSAYLMATNISTIRGMHYLGAGLLTIAGLSFLLAAFKQFSLVVDFSGGSMFIPKAVRKLATKQRANSRRVLDIRNEMQNLVAEDVRPLNHEEFSNGKWYRNILKVLQKYTSFETYGLKGIATGMILGLLPCGLIYGTIAIVVDSANNLIQAMAAMFVFGLATLPGLFISAYAGTIVFSRYKSWFRFFYVITMLLNAILLFSYAYTQVLPIV